MPPLPAPLRAPELGPGVWVQGPATTLAALRGRVVLLDFWEASCANCLRTLPALSEWHRRYAPHGLAILGIHTPEYAFTAEPEVIGAIARAEGLTYPILLDADRATWDLFAVHAWPTQLLLDDRGRIRYEHRGEGASAETEAFLRTLLEEAQAPPRLDLAVSSSTPVEPFLPAAFFTELSTVDSTHADGAFCRRPSGEVHLGWHRGRLLTPQGYRPGEEVEHTPLPLASLEPGAATARGRFLHEAEYVEVRVPGAELHWIAEGEEIHLVAAQAPGGEWPLRARIEVDGQPIPPEVRGEDIEAREGATHARWNRAGNARLLRGPFARRAVRLEFEIRGARLYAIAATGC